MQEDRITNEEIRDWETNRVTRYIYETIRAQNSESWRGCTDLQKLGRAQGIECILDMINRASHFFQQSKNNT